MIDTPVSRRLRVLAFDPSLTTRLETATINELTLSIPWEKLERGPIGEYVEVVDYDSSTGEVRVRLTGACGGCPMSQLTLQMGVERTLKEHIPEVKRVVQV